jgi:hypothetical protein
MAVREGFRVGKRNFEIDLVELFANMSNGESFEGAHHNAPPGRELPLPLTPKGYGLNSLSTQFLPEVCAQGIGIDIFDAAVKEVIVPSFSHSLGFADMDPVGGLVARPPEAGSFHKSFQKKKGMVVSPDPISRDPFGVEGKDLRCQALHRNPRQDEKSGVVGHHVQIVHFGGSAPTDELFSALYPPGSRPPTQASNGSFAKKSDVFEMAAHDLPVAEVMIASDEAVIEGLKGSVSNLSQGRERELTQKSRQRSLVDFYHGRSPITFIVVGAGERGRKADQPFSLKGEQELSTGHLAQPAVGLDPLPPLTQNLRDVGPSPLPMLIDSGLDLGNDSRSDRLFSNSQSFHEHRIAKDNRRRH